jgi:hypothetical protein
VALNSREFRKNRPSLSKTMVTLTSGSIVEQTKTSPKYAPAPPATIVRTTHVVTSNVSSDSTTAGSKTIPLNTHARNDASGRESERPAYHYSRHDTSPVNHENIIPVF